MDSIFGDASVANTPSLRSESGSLIPGSPVGSDFRYPGFPSGRIPDLSLNNQDEERLRGRTTETGTSAAGGVVGWLSRVVSRGRSDSNASSNRQGRYARLQGQDDD